MFFSAISDTLWFTLSVGLKILGVQIEAIGLILWCAYAQVKLPVSAGKGHARTAAAESRHLQISLPVVNKSEVSCGLGRQRSHL